MFRSFDLVYESDTSIKGIDLYRFTLAAESLYNQTLNPNNAQYFVTGPSGLQPIGQCSQGLPLYISKPHFLDCSSSVRVAIRTSVPPCFRCCSCLTSLPPHLQARSGLNIAKADRAKHDSYLDVEPITGATMNVAERLQASMLIGTKPADVKSSTFFPLVQPYVVVSARRVLAPVFSHGVTFPHPLQCLLSPVLAGQTRPRLHAHRQQVQVVGVHRQRRVPRQQAGRVHCRAHHRRHWHRFVRVGVETAPKAHDAQKPPNAGCRHPRFVHVHR